MKHFVFALTLGAALCGSVPASAVTYQVQFTGTITTGYDSTGVFGSVGDLGGSVVATFRFDTAAPGASYSPGNGSYSELTGFDAANPTIGATVQVNGITKSMPSGYGFNWASFGPAGTFNDIYADTGERFDNPPYSYVVARLSSKDTETPPNSGNIIPGNSFGHGPELYSAFVYLASSPDSSAGSYFQFIDAQGINNAFGFFDISKVEVSEFSAVPVPAALPLFASALIGGGVLAWRRRRKQAVPA